jgi:hypothetical protein
MILKELEPGDIFIRARSSLKRGKKYLVIGLPSLNQGRRRYERVCKHLGGETVFKPCDLEVVKVDESMQKAKMLKKQIHGYKMHLLRSASSGEESKASSGGAFHGAF